MLKYVLAFAISASLFTAHTAALAGEDELRFGLDGGYPPFASPNPDGQLVGFDIDLGEALCAEMHRKCVWVRQEWDALIPGLDTNKFDAILASMLITPERKEKVSFTNPYYAAKAVFVAPKSNTVAKVTPADLDGKTVGVETATAYGTYLQSKYGDKVMVRDYPTVTEAFADLKAGRIEYVLNDANSSYFAINRDGDDGALKLIGEPLVDSMLGEGVGIAVQKQNTELLKALNTALDQVVANGTYSIINKKYFPYDLR
ncbi:transporter substrate-binding domain-containing protein [Phyllobacterium zundukense]|uniref:Amino acid ABC transporter n=1 Tax=Phyllobacterium zundukense TaxID=1867719 RepID=A0A2N9VYI1_9HYPH|nr:transporter substrate-binding domain-containing protein [Phyllobacterium zundukense]ATU95138.1 amino acid ABC transporter [Phyllobacterium zundukense]PIO44549.1 amino acid ABC transporter [Phyllobacterium zundukense]